MAFVVCGGFVDAVVERQGAGAAVVDVTLQCLYYLTVP